MFEQLEAQLEKVILRSSITDSAHDIGHVKRVVKNAKHLAVLENADLKVVIPAAWLHDIVSLAKNAPNRAEASQLAADKASELLKGLSYPEQYLAAIHHAIKAHSYSAGIKAASIEAKVVQDADRLDALGAVGLARCFMVSGALQRPLYQLEDPFADHRMLDDSQFCIDHFYQKLFNLAQTMNTASAKEIAVQRSDYMRNFLQRFSDEIKD